MSPPPVEATAGTTESLSFESGEGEGDTGAPTLRFTGWCLWYGRATGLWWALSPAWCRERVGLVEADSLTELAAWMRRIESFRSQLSYDRHERPSKAGHLTVVAVSWQEDHGGGSDRETTGTGLMGEGGDRDGDASAVRTRRRTR